ncbi:hypothetical protein SH580_02395 [Coraliomargarita algicola]|uniref:Uncharacterized protein n=1 Tax=Coraliomargarita algicola TaxID=3092156 RepID=A0ABZ0RK24_9BACT|nr:hypothetical protein [Coraliomargarita sp. J2-16]WPJ96551.1 hypothetical protein SH580_02395 [Coraliomargarita sp. J2-16]
MDALGTVNVSRKRGLTLLWMDPAMDAIRQMKAIEQGDLAPTRVRVVNPENEVTKAHQELGLTQEAFAKLLTF